MMRAAESSLATSVSEKSLFFSRTGTPITRTGKKVCGSGATGNHPVLEVQIAQFDENFRPQGSVSLGVSDCRKRNRSALDQFAS